MKKLLIATSALVAVSAAGAASAAERPVGTIGGYMFFGLGLTDFDSNPGGTPGEGETSVGVLRDGEIHLGFTGSSDNGLTFTGRVEVEAHTDGDQIDENWAQVSGSFGSVLVGSNDTAGDNFGNIGYFCAAGCRLSYWYGFGEVPMGGPQDGPTDALGIRYATPTIAGFTAAVSYHPNWSYDGLNDTQYSVSGDARDGDTKDVISIAANYEGEFSGFGVALGADYLTGEGEGVTGDDVEVWSVGTELSYAGLALGVHYENDEENDAEDFLVGLSYGTGPWTFTGGWATTDNSYTRRSTTGRPLDPLGTSFTGSADVFAGWVSYALAPGVAAHVGAQYSDYYNRVSDENEGVYNAYAIMSVAF